MPFLLLPILTRYLSPEDYGVLSMFSILILCLGPAVRLELPAALRRNFHEPGRDFTADLGASLTLTLISFTVLSLIWAGLRLFVNEVFGVPISWVFGALVVVLGGSLTNYLVSLYQMQAQAFRAGFRAFLTALLTFVPTIILVVYFGFHWEGRAYSQLALALLFEIPVSLYLIHRMFPFRLKLERARMRDLLSFSLPLIPISFASYVLMTGDRMVMGRSVPLSTIGVFTVAVQLASLIRLIMTSFYSSWEIAVYKHLHEAGETARARIVALFYIFATVALAGAVLVAFVAPLGLPLVVGDRYVAAAAFLPWLAFAELFRALTVCIYNIFYFHKRTFLVNKLIVALAILHAALLIPMVSLFGAMGAAQASLISATIGFIVVVLISNRLVRLPWVSFARNAWQ